MLSLWGSTWYFLFFKAFYWGQFKCLIQKLTLRQSTTNIFLPSRKNKAQSSIHGKNRVTSMILCLYRLPIFFLLVCLFFIFVFSSLYTLPLLYTLWCEKWYRCLPISSSWPFLVPSESDSLCLKNLGFLLQWWGLDKDRGATKFWGSICGIFDKFPFHQRGRGRGDLILPVFSRVNTICCWKNLIAFTAQSIPIIASYCFIYNSNWGPGPQPINVPWLVIEPATSQFTSWHSVHWVIPASAVISEINHYWYLSAHGKK